MNKELCVYAKKIRTLEDLNARLIKKLSYVPSAYNLDEDHS